ncbi:hypothetical protein [Phormidium nigroviride]
MTDRFSQKPGFWDDLRKSYIAFSSCLLLYVTVSVFFVDYCVSPIACDRPHSSFHLLFTRKSSDAGGTVTHASRILFESSQLKTF